MIEFWKRPKVILWTFFTILFLIIILQNLEPTQIHILFWSLPQIPKLVLILISMGLGALLSILISWEFRSKSQHSSQPPQIPPF